MERLYELLKNPEGEASNPILVTANNTICNIRQPISIDKLPKIKLDGRDILPFNRAVYDDVISRSKSLTQSSKTLKIGSGRFEITHETRSDVLADILDEILGHITDALIIETKIEAKNPKFLFLKPGDSIILKDIYDMTNNDMSNNKGVLIINFPCEDSQQQLQDATNQQDTMSYHQYSGPNSRRYGTCLKDFYSGFWYLAHRMDQKTLYAPDYSDYRVLLVYSLHEMSKTIPNEKFNKLVDVLQSISLNNESRGFVLENKYLNNLKMGPIPPKFKLREESYDYSDHEDVDYEKKDQCHAIFYGNKYLLTGVDRERYDFLIEANKKLDEEEQLIFSVVTIEKVLFSQEDERGVLETELSPGRYYGYHLYNPYPKYSLDMVCFFLFTFFFKFKYF